MLICVLLPMLGCCLRGCGSTGQLRLGRAPRTEALATAVAAATPSGSAPAAGTGRSAGVRLGRRQRCVLPHNSARGRIAVGLLLQSEDS